MNGNVGIGTWVPGAALQIGTGTSFNINGSATLGGNLNMGFASIIMGAGDSIYDSSAGIGFPGGDLALNSNSIQRVTIKNNGNVGIGSIMPNGSLDVEGTVYPTVFNAVSGTLNVGIGSFAPGQKLDIQGTARMTGFNLSTSPTSGYVLTSDTNGNGTWQAASTGTNYWNYSSSGNIGVSTVQAVGIGTTFIGGTGEAALSVMNGNVGIGTWVPAAQLDIEGTLSNSNFGGNVTINGTLSVSYMNVTSNTTLNATNNIVFVNTTGGAVTITLPTAVGIGGRCYRIVDSGGAASTNNITIASNGGNISGSSTQTMIDSYSSDYICSNGTNWFLT
jgi:hypothetical protein